MIVYDILAIKPGETTLYSEVFLKIKVRIGSRQTSEIKRILRDDFGITPDMERVRRVEGNPETNLVT